MSVGCTADCDNTAATEREALVPKSITLAALDADWTMIVNETSLNRRWTQYVTDSEPRPPLIAASRAPLIAARTDINAEQAHIAMDNVHQLPQMTNCLLAVPLNVQC